MLYYNYIVVALIVEQLSEGSSISKSAVPSRLSPRRCILHAIYVFGAFVGESVFAPEDESF